MHTEVFFPEARCITLKFSPSDSMQSNNSFTSLTNSTDAVVDDEDEEVNSEESD